MERCLGLQSPMQTLADLQRDFSAALRDAERPVPGAVLPVGAGLGARGFDVYRNNVAVSLIEALEAAFPAVRKLVGEEFFKALARAFIAKQPPRSPVLLLYGQGFGDFLQDFPPVRELPYLVDVARLEWARLHAYHAADAETLEIGCLSALPEEDLGGLRFSLHPSLVLVRSRWPVVSLWAASSGADPEAAVDMKSAQAAAVIRPELTVDVRLLPTGGHGFLELLMADATLAEAAAQGAEGDPAFNLAERLQGLFQIGAVTALRRPASDSQQG